VACGFFAFGLGQGTLESSGLFPAVGACTDFLAGVFCLGLPFDFSALGFGAGAGGNRSGST